MKISTSLSDFLVKQGEAARFNLINHHGLWGFTYKHWSNLLPELKHQAKDIYLKQWLQNQTYQKVLTNLRPRILLIDDSLLILKGMNHLDDLYEDDIAVRFMSDIDLLVAPDKLENIKSLLIDEGFKANENEKWFGDQHKIELHQKIDGVDITIELHTKLLYHLDHFGYEKIRKPDGSWQLQIEERLVYLCAHYAFQHTMLKLYWFIDIALLIEKYPLLNWERCKAIAKKWQVYNSFCYTIGVINESWGPIAPPIKGTFQLAISNDLIWNTDQRSFKYLMAKNLVKDSFKTHLKYAYLWLKRKKSN